MDTTEYVKTDLELLIDRIRKDLPELMKIEKGQIFNSKYYGNIVATVITTYNKYNNCIIDVYGFDEKEGLPRSNYYPRDLTLVGKEPMLNDVLRWFDLQEFKYAHFEKDYFLIYNGEETNIIKWDLSSPYLKNQSDELIDFLLNEVATN